MSDKSAIHLAGIDQEVLLPIIRQVTQRDGAVLLDWQTQALQGGVGDLGAGLVGVHRFTGQINDHGAIIPWSIVLKSVQGNAEQGAADYFTREWFAYRSGFLGSLSGPVMAPQCFGTLQQAENVLGIWLEDLGNIRDQPWTMASHALVARHFGAWNGAYLVTDTRPDFSWFCHSTASEWMQQAEPSIAVLRESLTHPAIQRLYPEQQADTILRLWDERTIFLNALAQLPQTVCHNDAFRRNLHLREPAARHAQVVAFDWANVGWGAVGEELAAMVAGNLAFSEVPLAQATEFTEMLFQSYLEGLRQAGWGGDERLVRLGFTAAATLKYGFPYLLFHLFSEEGETRLAEILNQSQIDSPRMASAQQFVFGLAAEARVLIHSLGL